MSTVTLEIEKILKSLDVDQLRLYIKLLACKIHRKARNRTTKKCLGIILKDTEGLFVSEEALIKTLSKLEDESNLLAAAAAALGWALWYSRHIDEYKQHVTYLLECAKKAKISESDQYEILSCFKTMR